MGRRKVNYFSVVFPYRATESNWAVRNRKFFYSRSTGPLTRARGIHVRPNPAHASCHRRLPTAHAWPAPPPPADRTPPRRWLLRPAVPPPVTAATRPDLRCPVQPPSTAALLSLRRPPPDPSLDSPGPPPAAATRPGHGLPRLAPGRPQMPPDATRPDSARPP
jgi:hypothetical protein